jgi:hypothetical protein
MISNMYPPDRVNGPGGMVGNVLHGLVSIVEIPELGNEQSIVRITIKAGVLKAIFVTSQLGSNLKGMIKTIVQVSVK